MLHSLFLWFLQFVFNLIPVFPLSETWGLPEVQLVEAGICQVVVSSLVDVSLRLDLVVVWKAVHLVHEHLEVDVGVDSEGAGHGEV